MSTIDDPNIVPRRYDEPVTCLPLPRQKPNDRHHLFWPGADISRVGLKDFRELACTVARRPDSMVHTLIHQRFFGVVGLNRPEVRRDLQKRTNMYVELHNRRRCFCYNHRRVQVIDALTLEAFRPSQFDRPACTGLAVDPQIAELMRDYYAVVAPVTDQVRAQLEQRCDSGLCGCWVRQGNRKILMPPVWKQAA